MAIVALVMSLTELRRNRTAQVLPLINGRRRQRCTARGFEGPSAFSRAFVMATHARARVR